MKTRHFTFFLLLLFSHAAVAQQWTWMNGSQAANVPGTYGTRGTPAAANIPGSRTGAVTWTDPDGNFWLFGGRGNGENATGLLNDLWRYNPNNKQWTWISGNKNPNGNGRYGEKGEFSSTNQPGARENAVSWTDNRGNFWMFGGTGVGEREGRTGFLCDLWMYSRSRREWMWVSGKKQTNEKGEYGKRGESSRSFFPGGRMMATTWRDGLGNLWLFGGRGYASDDDDVSDLNDLWRFSLITLQWAWMKGDDEEDADARYGEKGKFSNPNTPGGRRGATGWTDRLGNLWLFGGGTVSDFYSDLWTYDILTNRWAWISGDNKPNTEPIFTERGVADVNANPGARLRSAGWVDLQGNLWLFGGVGYGRNAGTSALNSLWKYAPSSNSWTFVTGQAAPNGNAIYGNIGEASAGNTPGATDNASEWRDGEGNFWLFGGSNPAGNLNQLWKFSMGCGTNTTGTITPEEATICENGSQILVATGGTSYEWRLNGVAIPGATGSTIKATQAGTYSVIVKNGSCSGPATNTAIVTLGTVPTGTISPASASICEGETQVLTATGGTSYEWKLDGRVIQGQTGATLNATKQGTYSVTITNGSCSGPASNTASIKTKPTPSGQITPASATLCDGATQVLTANGGSSYEWFRDDEIIEGETGATITVAESGTYSVIINNGTCTAPGSNTAVITAISNTGNRYEDVNTKANVPVQLNARPIGVTYGWSPSEGLDNPSSASPMATLDADREYTVTITTDEGCMVTDTVLVKITPDTTNTPGTPVTPGTKKPGYVPTAFTPNGNNMNDQLRPLGNLATINYFKVFNRWGNMVFQTNQVGTGWDGRYKGSLQPADTYTWVLSAVSTTGEKILLTGKTLLIR